MSENSPTPQQPTSYKAVAPAWHTAVFVLAVLGLAAVGLKRFSGMAEHHNRMASYLLSIAFEVAMVGYVWAFGLHPRGGGLRELIGGEWKRASDVLLDAGVAILFWMAVGTMLGLLRAILGPNPAGLRAMKLILPQTVWEMGVFLLLSVTAGFCEELLFRGYLQRQFLALTRRPAAAVVLQALVFGAAHSYQGWKGAVTITVYGAMFGILALLRKSLRPGMIQHAMQDSFTGIVGSVLARRGYF